MRISSLLDDRMMFLVSVEQGILEWLVSDDPIAAALVSAIWIVVIVAVAIVVSYVLVKVLRKLLYRDSIPLVGAKTVINLVRFFVWFSAFGLALDLVFGIDVAALITALGIGGIAISLGCQDTLLNLIGGIQISMQRLIDIGDRIEIEGREGVVEDCNWRHMLVCDYSGNFIKIPNSMINNSILITRPEYVYAEAPILVRYEHVGEGRTLDDFASELGEELREAVEEVSHVQKGPTFRFTGMTDFGYQGVVSFSVEAGVTPSVVKDAVIRRIARLGL